MGLKFKYLFILPIIIYILSPFIWRYSTWIQRNLIFMNHVNTQYNFNLSQPEDLGLKCTRTLKLLNDDIHYKSSESSSPSIDIKIELGTWHILPESSIPLCHTISFNNRTTIDDNIAFSDSKPIILYFHGNGGNRGNNHRSKLYKRLAYDYDHHVVTFDYRGYGDSTNIQPTADGLSSDARFLYEWLLKQENVTRERIIIWSHSLGTAVAIKMLADLPEQMRPSKLVLEAPMNSIANAVATHPISTPFLIVPYFNYFFVKPIEMNPDINFDSENRIGDIKSMQILILHAEDDGIIPIELGLKLYKTAIEKLGENNVKFLQISGNHGLGHKHICVHDETMSKVRNFLDRDEL